MLRDFVQRRLGLTWSLVAIAVGTVISWIISPPNLVLASVVAFLFCELADALLFTPLQRKGLIVALLASGLIDICVDCLLFLMLALGSLHFLGGQIIGKVWSLLIAVPLVRILRNHDQSRGISPAKQGMIEHAKSPVSSNPSQKSASQSKIQQPLSQG